MFTIDRGSGSILFANGMNVSGVAQGIDIGGPDSFGEYPCRRSPLRNCIVDDGIGRRADQPLRQRLRLRKQAPGPEAESQPSVRPVPRGGRGDDIEDGNLGHFIGVVERQR